MEELQNSEGLVGSMTPQQKELMVFFVKDFQEAEWGVAKWGAICDTLQAALVIENGGSFGVPEAASSQ